MLRLTGKQINQMKAGKCIYLGYETRFGWKGYLPFMLSGVRSMVSRNHIYLDMRINYTVIDV